MREIGLVFAGVAVGLAWIVIWAALLHVLGISSLREQTEDIAAKRERLRRIGMAKYIVVFGVLWAGVGFAAMNVTIDIVRHERQLGWALEFTKFLVLAVLFGSFLGYRNWRRAFLDPAPYPPKYSTGK
jgi:hypothetical protein